MIESLKAMLHLQEIDQELASLQDDVRRFEPVIEGVKRERARRTAATQKREQEIASAATQRRKLELELKEAESKASRFRKQQEQVRTAKEAEALQHEADAAQSSVSSLEERILELLEKEEQLAAAHADKNAHNADLESESATEQARLETLRTEKVELAKALQGDRIAAANRLEEDLRDSYEWLRKRHGPTAVVKVQQGACAGCGNVLVAQTAIKAQAADSLIQCPNCQRYLY